ncbi:tRNA 2-thiouridine(34) synthase MnmA [candidate division WWE3 bacterium RBG_19FT_COMBO_34_6]|uniref:tRNA-specific 2-thiouridylase MnmA n=1 Tax=candidate division WWE3 bacterium RBG_19FT_COMBO_34_6 TaxID=1802612 RepID=A0A1F4UMV7_UNCKA|nr:MAG: tRNA 2-thiouridine(34) synthase MnmA [candidate division WWE3 bacterium RBG_19FT_COMBO_34_6]
MKSINTKKIKVAVGVSGGVDSSVAAYLLKEQGYDVVGIYLQCWDKKTDGCSSDEDRSFAISVCSKLGIEFNHLNYVAQYKKRVIDYFYNSYEKGLTPNPDILCNSEIKFGLFLNWVLNNGFDYLATGHYTRVKKSKENEYSLLKGIDPDKGQSYFLYRLNQHQLSKVMFPIGDLTKKQVRKIAEDIDLPTYNRPDSQGICFIGEVDIKKFLQKRLKIKKGKVLFTNGEEVGEHDGVWFYTIGQRHGFKVNKYFGLPLYVVSKNASNNTIVVGYASDVLKDEFCVTDASWVNKKIDNKAKVDVRIRHLGDLFPGTVTFKKNDTYKVVLTEKPFGVAPGQSAVFYKGEEVLGGGIIL